MVLSLSMSKRKAASMWSRLDLPSPFHLSASECETLRKTLARLSAKRPLSTRMKVRLRFRPPKVWLARTRRTSSGSQAVMPTLPPVAPACGESASGLPCATLIVHRFSWSAYYCG
jgi:hypothetical protein